MSTVDLIRTIVIVSGIGMGALIVVSTMRRDRGMLIRSWTGFIVLMIIGLALHAGDDDALNHVGIWIGVGAVVTIGAGLAATLYLHEHHASIRVWMASWTPGGAAWLDRQPQVLSRLGICMDGMRVSFAGLSANQPSDRADGLLLARRIDTTCMDLVHAARNGSAQARGLLRRWHADEQIPWATMAWIELHRQDPDALVAVGTDERIPAEIRDRAWECLAAISPRHPTRSCAHGSGI